MMVRNMRLVQSSQQHNERAQSNGDAGSMDSSILGFNKDLGRVELHCRFCADLEDATGGTEGESSILHLFDEWFALFYVSFAEKHKQDFSSLMQNRGDILQVLGGFNPALNYALTGILTLLSRVW